MLTRSRFFADRREAGRRLGERLQHLTVENPLVIGLPRGGVPVAHEVATALGAPLDVIVARKLRAPLQPELGVGAVAEGGVVALNGDVVEALRLGRPQLETLTRHEQRELSRRVRRYRGGRPALDVAGRTVILVDDGIATGFTAIAAARALRGRGARRIVLAVPVAPPDARERFAGEVDDYVCLSSPPGFFAVGAYYEHFDQVGDDEVAALLADPDGDPPAAADPPPSRGGIDWSRVEQEEVAIPTASGASLAGDLRLPPDPDGLVLFAHGSGSSRHSPRNVQVAGALCADGFATLLFDLLDEREAADRRLVFDIPLLASRLEDATRWAFEDPRLAALPVGYFGASTGAAAALRAAARLGDRIAAVVSRGGRPDLAGESLAQVASPVLLIVGGADRAVLELNRQAQHELPHSALLIVPGAGHLFEEWGALEQVSEQATRWFAEHLVKEG